MIISDNPLRLTCPHCGKAKHIRTILSGNAIGARNRQRLRDLPRLLILLEVSMMLLSVRKQIPQLRQREGLEQKLDGYAAHVRDLYMTMLAVVVILCAFTFLSGRTVLLMLAMISTLVLFLNFPNIYRIKVDLGLTDDEAQMLFGDRYIPDNRNNQNEQ